MKYCFGVDIGGTTTDIAFVKKGVPQRVKNGVRIGKWDTFVKGLFVDTFGLGGDSGKVYGGEDGSKKSDVRFDDIAGLDEWGYIDSDEACLTKTPGVFTAGDCRKKLIRQITTAAADGSVAALAACRYIDNL